jgi:hypothetical protein
MRPSNPLCRFAEPSLAFLANFNERVEEYCVCVVNGVPIRNLRPGESAYVQLILRHTIEPSGRDETQKLMADQGLNDDKMAAATNRFLGWTSKCNLGAKLITLSEP